MVIVHILTRLLRAGSEENTLATCRSQADDGHRIVIMHGREFDAAIRREAEKMAEVVTIESMVHAISPYDDVRAVMAMASSLVRLKAGVVHTHQSKAGVLGRLAARLARTPAIVHGVHILPFVNVGRAQKIMYVAAERFCAQFTDAFINVSPSVRDACIERGIGSPERHFVAFSAMDVARFKSPSPPRDWRELLNVAEGAKQPPTAVMLAAFEPRKRQLELIRALPEAFADIPDWRLLFAGEGETLTESRALVEMLGLKDRVRFAGYRRDPEAIIALADVCLLTSRREGMPRVLVQYVAAGKPCVVSDLPGLEDVVRDGVSAIITSGPDVGAAVRAAAKLLVDPVERARLAAGAAAIDVEAWSPERMNARIRDAYAAALGQPAGQQ
jgi:glycosyltransferase involved in cell wall biosynthesis